jgi:hypothetical protein
MMSKRNNRLYSMPVENLTGAPLKDFFRDTMLKGKIEEQLIGK